MKRIISKTTKQLNRSYKIKGFFLFYYCNIDKTIDWNNTVFVVVVVVEKKRKTTKTWLFINDVKEIVISVYKVYKVANVSLMYTSAVSSRTLLITLLTQSISSRMLNTWPLNRNQQSLNLYRSLMMFIMHSKCNSVLK